MFELKAELPYFAAKREMGAEQGLTLTGQRPPHANTVTRAQGAAVQVIQIG